MARIVQRGGHSGSALVARRRSLPGEPNHSRSIEADLDGLVVGCLYLRNGNPVPGPKFDYKLRWFNRLIRYGRELQGGMPRVLCGNFNDVLAP